MPNQQAGPPTAAQSSATEFSDAFRQNYPDLLRFVSRRIGAEAGEDVTAEVFARAWKSWAKAPSPPRPWLFGIAHNLVVNHYRKTERDERLQNKVDAAPQWLEMPHDGTETRLDLARAWTQLTAADRDVIALVAWDGLTGAEAATVLGCTRAAFAVRLTRARRRLRRLLDAEPMREKNTDSALFQANEKLTRTEGTLPEGCAT